MSTLTPLAAAEHDLIGAAIGNPEITATTRLDGHHFDDPSRGAIWDAIRDINQTSTTRPDPITIAQHVTDTRVDPNAVVQYVGQGIPANAQTYADIIRDAWQRRGLLQALVAARQAIDAGEPLDAAINALDQATSNLGDAGDTLPDGMALEDFTAQPLPPEEWVIPRLLAKGDRLVLTGSEGLGKTLLLREIAVCAAAGIDPFTYDRYPPKRVLVVDVENPLRIMVNKFRALQESVRDLGEDTGRRLHIVRRPEGMDLAKSSDRLYLHQLCRKLSPDMLVIGPAYKLYVGGAGSREEDLARQVTSTLDGLREEFGFALLLEHHSPHAAPGQRRSPRPIGSSLWMRWPEFGLGLVDDAESLDHAALSRGARRVRLVPWRGHRDERPWPQNLESSSRLPWSLPDEDIANYVP